MTDLAPSADELDIPGLIRRARRIADLSQRELADRVGVSQTRVARWETGQAEPGVRQFAEVLELARLSLEVVDAAGSPARAMPAQDAPLDRQARLLPAHLDIHEEDDPYTGVQVVSAPRRPRRDRLRHRRGSVPVDHPSRADLVACREERKRPVRERVRAFQEYLRAKAAAQHAAGGAGTRQDAPPPPRWNLHQPFTPGKGSSDGTSGPLRDPG